MIFTNMPHMRPEMRHLFRRPGGLGSDRTRWQAGVHQLDRGVGVVDHPVGGVAGHLRGAAGRSPR
jgi:hypothetical protein